MVFSLMFLVSTLCVGGWSHTIDWNVPEAEAVKAGDNFDWQLGGPVQFIEHLKAERHNKQRATYPIGGCHVGCGRPETTGPTRVVAFLHESYDLQERWASVRFFSREESRIHVHVQGERAEAKFWSDPEVELAQNHGLSRRSLATALRLIREHEDEIRAAWKKQFRR